MSEIGKVDIVTGGHGLVLGRMRKTVGDQFGDRGFDGALRAFGAAAAPFDAAIGVAHGGVAVLDDGSVEVIEADPALGTTTSARALAV